MQIHELKRKSPNKKARQIGRGGKRGTTSGRGTKGQKARAGRKMRPELRDIIKKLPKRRGYRFNTVSDKSFPVNLGLLNKNFNEGEVVSPETLLKKKLVRKQAGKLPAIKILAEGAIAKSLSIVGCSVSTAAKEKVEKAGGSVK